MRATQHGTRSSSNGAIDNRPDPQYFSFRSKRAFILPSDTFVRFDRTSTDQRIASKLTISFWSAIAHVAGKKHLTGKTDLDIAISNQCGRLIANAVICYNSAILSRLFDKYRATGTQKALALLRKISPELNYSKPSWPVRTACAAFTNRDIRVRLASTVHLRACGQRPRKESAKVSRTFAGSRSRPARQDTADRRWHVTLYGRRVMGSSLYLRAHHFPEAYSRIAA